MADLKYLEGRVAGQAYDVMMDACKARLGYELLKLAESPQTMDASRVSLREDAGIGIDSNLPKPFRVPKDAGDYHKWPLFGLEDRLNHGIEDELIQRVVYLMPEEAIVTLRELRTQRDEQVSRGNWFNTKISYLDGGIYSNATQFARSEPKLQAKIQALLSNPAWRDYARQFNVQLLQSAQTRLRENAEEMLADLDDIAKGQRVVGTAQPVLDDLQRLLQMYAEEMEVRLT